MKNLLIFIDKFKAMPEIQDGEEVTDSDIDAHDSLVIILAILYFGTYVGCVVLFLMWKHKASKNLAPLGVSNQRFSPRWAVAYYFIPILNLFRPYQVMKEIYLRSGGGGTTPSYSILTAWWGMWIISEFINNRIARQFFKEHNIDDLIALNYASIVGDFLTIVAGILVFVVVSRITTNQETSWSKIAETEENRMPPIPPKSFPSGSN